MEGAPKFKAAQEKSLEERHEPGDLTEAERLSLREALSQVGAPLKDENNQKKILD